jgi:phosphate ABC transporter permease protein PstC
MIATRRFGRVIESLIEYFILGCAFTSIVVLFLIFIFLFEEGLPTFIHIPWSEFFFGTVWQVQAVEPRYGILPLLCGSILVTGGAIIFSVPLSLMCALYISEVAHPLVREVIKPFIELLAGIPSVVYGFLALTVLADLTQSFTGSIHRLNALNGALILAVMITPTIISISEDAITSVPREYREAAYAIGADKWETMSRVVFPTALPGVVVAVMLGISRAIGETMAVLMATGNAPLLTFDILSSVQTMTAVIAIEMGEVTFGSIHYHALFAVGLVLLGITFIVNYLAEAMLRRIRGLRF